MPDRSTRRGNPENFGGSWQSCNAAGPEDHVNEVESKGSDGAVLAAICMVWAKEIDPAGCAGGATGAILSMLSALPILWFAPLFPAELI
jgi:hypothetical protein